MPLIKILFHPSGILYGIFNFLNLDFKNQLIILKNIIGVKNENETGIFTLSSF